MTPQEILDGNRDDFVHISRYFVHFTGDRTTIKSCDKHLSDRFGYSAICFDVYEAYRLVLREVVLR